MHLIGSDEQNISAPDPVRCRSIGDISFAIDDDDFMLIVVRVMRRMSAGGDYIMSHGKVGSPMLATHQDFHARVLHAIHGHRYRVGGIRSNQMQRAGRNCMRRATGFRINTRTGGAD